MRTIDAPPSPEPVDRGAIHARSPWSSKRGLSQYLRVQASELFDYVEDSRFDVGVLAGREPAAGCL